MKHTRLYSATLQTYDSVLMSGIYWSVSKAHNAIKKSLRARLRLGTIMPTTTIMVEIKDASGYFKSCPDVFPDYYKKSTTVEAYIK